MKFDESSKDRRKVVTCQCDTWHTRDRRISSSGVGRLRKCKKATGSPSRFSTLPSVTNLHSRYLSDLTFVTTFIISFAFFLCLIIFQNNSMVGLMFISLSELRYSAWNAGYHPLPGAGWTCMPFLGINSIIWESSLMWYKLTFSFPYAIRWCHHNTM
jgi:hypothetical protein